MAAHLIALRKSSWGVCMKIRIISFENSFQISR
jgi:hypothetical protein